MKSKRNIFIITLISLSLSLILFILCTKQGSQNIPTTPVLSSELSSTLHNEEEIGVKWDGISDFKDRVTYEITPEQFELFCKKDPEMGMLLLKAMNGEKVTSKVTVDDSISKKKKINGLSLSTIPGDCDATATCACGGSWEGTADAQVGPGPLDGVIEVWANGKFRRSFYHAGEAQLKDHISKPSSGSCISGATARMTAYCYAYDNSGC